MSMTAFWITSRYIGCSTAWYKIIHQSWTQLFLSEKNHWWSLASLSMVSYAESAYTSWCHYVSQQGHPHLLWFVSNVIIHRIISCITLYTCIQCHANQYVGRSVTKWPYLWQHLHRFWNHKYVFALIWCIDRGMRDNFNITRITKGFVYLTQSMNDLLRVWRR